MKKILILLALFIVFATNSQEKLGRQFITGSFNFTLGINENYSLSTNDESLIIPAAIFLRTGFGYEIQRKLAISFNAGFDYHWNFAVSAIPTYGSLKYNITERDDDAFFTEISYGKMWRLSNNYPDGNYYSLGMGVQVSGESRTHTIVRIDFHRKGILGFENNRLDSFSIGIGFSFF